MTEQHGSVRVNLIGREAKGIVPVQDYATVCREVEEWLHILTTSDGKPLAKKVIEKFIELQSPPSTQQHAHVEGASRAD